MAAVAVIGYGYAPVMEGQQRLRPVDAVDLAGHFAGIDVIDEQAAVAGQQRFVLVESDDAAERHVTAVLHHVINVHLHAAQFPAAFVKAAEEEMLHALIGLVPCVGIALRARIAPALIAVLLAEEAVRQLGHAADAAAEFMPFLDLQLHRFVAFQSAEAAVDAQPVQTVFIDVQLAVPLEDLALVQLALADDLGADAVKAIFRHQTGIEIHAIVILVDRRIIGLVNELGHGGLVRLLPTAAFPVLAAVGLRTAAGGEAQQHGRSQKERQDLFGVFHIVPPWKRSAQGAQSKNVRIRKDRPAVPGGLHV